LVWATVFGLAAALMLLGHDQVAMLGAWALLGYALHEALSAERPVRWLRERLRVMVIAAGIVGLLVGPCLLLTLQLAAVSNRPTIPLEEALTGSLSPVNLFTMLAPDFSPRSANMPNTGARPIPAGPAATGQIDRRTIFIWVPYLSCWFSGTG